MADEKILAEKKGAVGTLTFNAPEKRNAISPEMSEAAAEVLEDFSADDAIRVIVLTGAGDKAFVSGGDISTYEKQRATAEQQAAYNKRSARLRTVLRNAGKPTIAKIRGYCLGGGMAIALNCDLRICSEDAQFGIPAAKLGIGYGVDALALLVQLTGPSVAKEILFTARRINAQEALRTGVVNQVVPAAELDAFVDSYAQTIAANAPLSIIAAKRTIDECVKDGQDRNTELCEQLVADCFASQDYIEGRRAFMEKRKPVFTGR